MKYRVRRSSRLEASPASVWQALTDYPSFVAWVPGVSGVEVLAREGNVAIVELQRRGGPPLVLEVIEIDSEHTLRLHQTDQIRHRGLEGCISLHPAEAAVRVEVDLHYRCSLFEPFSHRSWRQMISSRLSALQARAMRWEAGEVGQRDEVTESLLEVFEDADGLVIRLAGTTYRLVSS